MTCATIPDWFAQHDISEVEALVPDMSGIARGKIMPADVFDQVQKIVTEYRSQAK